MYRLKKVFRLSNESDLSNDMTVFQRKELFNSFLKNTFFYSIIRKSFFKLYVLIDNEKPLIFFPIFLNHKRAVCKNINGICYNNLIYNKCAENLMEDCIRFFMVKKGISSFKLERIPENSRLAAACRNGIDEYKITIEQRPSVSIYFGGV